MMRLPQEDDIHDQTLPVLNLVVGAASIAALLAIEAKMVWRYVRCWLVGQVWCASKHSNRTVDSPMQSAPPARAI